MSIEYVKVKIAEETPITIKTEENPINIKVTGAGFVEGVIDVDSIKNYVKIETPTELAPNRFQTANQYISGLLEVYLNGLKLSTADVTEISTQIFEISIDTISTDVVEVKYFKKP